MAKSKSRRHHAHPSIEIMRPAPVAARVANRSVPKTIDAVVLARIDLPTAKPGRAKPRSRLALLAVSGADGRKSHPAGPSRPVVNIYGQPSYAVQPMTPRPPAAHAVLRNGVWRGPDGKPMKSAERVPHNLGFRNPSKLVLCLKRKMRREVMLALGKGGGRHKKGRRGPLSKIWC